MSARRELDKTLDTIDRELMELQIIAAVRNLKERHPGHPFVVAITMVLDSVPPSNPDQQELQL